MRDAAAKGLNVSIEHVEGVALVRAEGEVDLETADPLLAALRAASGMSDRIVCDLLGVPFMDSSGLKALLMYLAEHDGRLALVLSPGAPVARLLELADVRERFVIHATPDEAVAAAREDR
jgi:anti-anti-sigma factor